jgi:hypothetical protein
MSPTLRASRCAITGGALLIGCGDPLYLGSDVVWLAAHEDGTLDEWSEASSGGADLDLGGSGTPGTAEPSSEFARSGAYSVKLTRSALDAETGPALYRELGALNAAYYASWFLVPEGQHPASRWTIMKFRLRGASSPGSLAEGLDLDLRAVPEGGYVLSVFDHDDQFLQEPIAAPPPLVQGGRWFHLEVFYRSANRDGGVMVWLDGREVYALAPHPTSAQGAYFMTCNVAIDSVEASVYVDDASISLSRVTPDGLLKR